MPPIPDTLASGAERHLVEPDAAQRATAGHEPPAQQCGRCRLLFEGDPTLHPVARPDWWLCSPCRAILLGRNPHHSGVPHRRHVGDES